LLIEIRNKAFNAWTEVQIYQDSQSFRGQYGAIATFVGSMRDFNEDKKVTGMTLEHYPGMTEKHLEAIAKDAIGKWKLLDVLILHRIGKVKIGEDIVLVVTWSAHRKEAFESCRAIMEQLKSSAPFWKREDIKAGSKWVEKNTPGY